MDLSSVVKDTASRRQQKQGDEVKESSSDQPRQQKVMVLKWNGVAFWTYNIQNDNCAICRNLMTVPCIGCEAEGQYNLSEECSIAWGICGHNFHFHCITKWLKNQSTCPLDSKTWEWSRME